MPRADVEVLSDNVDDDTRNLSVAGTARGFMTGRHEETPDPKPPDIDEVIVEQ